MMKRYTVTIDGFFLQRHSLEIRASDARVAVDRALRCWLGRDPDSGRLRELDPDKCQVFRITVATYSVSPFMSKRC